MHLEADLVMELTVEIGAVLLYLEVMIGILP
ncbi:MAG: hypothetical protein K0R50_1029 [Eubacterium sp.]|jgi:hypothetical protein|nr:hypothetical protein [Eubacterium sp.]